MRTPGLGFTAPPGDADTGFEARSVEDPGPREDS